jgi:hypothetical protein
VTARDQACADRANRGEAKGSAEFPRVGRKLASEQRSKLIEPASRLREAELQFGEAGHSLFSKISFGYEPGIITATNPDIKQTERGSHSPDYCRMASA